MTVKEHIAGALQDMGFTIEVHDQPQTLQGWHGESRPEQAEIIIRRQNTGLGLSNDVGFSKQADKTFKAIVSDYDQSKFNSAWLKSLTRGYEEKRICAINKQRGRVFAGREVVQTPMGERVKLRFTER